MVDTCFQGLPLLFAFNSNEFPKKWLAARLQLTCKMLCVLDQQSLKGEIAA